MYGASVSDVWEIGGGDEVDDAPDVVCVDWYIFISFIIKKKGGRTGLFSVHGDTEGFSNP